MDGPLDKAERIHVLDLGACAKGIRAFFTQRDVDIAAHRALCHVAVRDSKVRHQRVERLEVRHRLFRRSKVGFGHDLKKRCAGAVEIDACLPAEGVVDRFAGIFLQMRAGNTDRKKRPVFKWHLENTFADDGRKKLTHLVTLG